MKKILISAALITGFVAPAIFAAAQYVAYGQENSQSVSTSSLNGNGEVSTIVKKCMKGVVGEFNKEKKKTSASYKEKIKYLIQGTLDQGTVSGEKSLRKEKLQRLQKEYTDKLASLKAAAIAKQRSCIQN